MIIERNKVDVKLDQTEILVLEQAFYRMADFENQLALGVSEDELPAGVKTQMIDCAVKIKDDITSFLAFMDEDTTALYEY